MKGLCFLLSIPCRLKPMFCGQEKRFIEWFKPNRPLSIRLANTRSRYHLPTYPPHDALTDAIATAELLQAQIHYHFDGDTPIKKLWL